MTGLSLSLALFLCHPGAGQAAQNPSPMVEHARAHHRLKEERPAGRRIPLKIGTLFLPEKLRNNSPLIFHFHGAGWIPEIAAARNRIAIVSVQLGSGSGAYARPFMDSQVFRELVEEAQEKARHRFNGIGLTAWSAGYGAIREILQRHYDRIDTVLLLDGLHSGYVNGRPGPVESELVEEGLAEFVRFARDAVSGRKRFLLTHTEIFPGTFASTTETADYLLKQVGLRRRPVLRWGPLGTQILSESRKGRFHLLGFAGNSAPDHVDLLHALPDLWKLFGIP